MNSDIIQDEEVEGSDPIEQNQRDLSAVNAMHLEE